MALEDFPSATWGWAEGPPPPLRPDSSAVDAPLISCAPANVETTLSPAAGQVQHRSPGDPDTFSGAMSPSSPPALILTTPAEHPAGRADAVSSQEHPAGRAAAVSSEHPTGRAAAVSSRPPSPPKQHPRPPPAPWEQGLPHPDARSTTDPELFWLNRRPFLIHTSCGKGAFGDVFKVEMMVPLGYEVARDADGFPVFEENGLVAVRPSSSEEPPTHGRTSIHGAWSPEDAGGPPGGAAGHPGAAGSSYANTGVSYESSSFLFPSNGASSWNDEEAQALAALELSENSPEAMSFFKVSGAEAGAPTTVVDRPEPEDVAHDFIVDQAQFVVGCGVFFALKIQAAQTDQMMKFFTQEIENLRALQGHGAEDHIIQIRYVCVTKRVFCR